MPTVDFCARAVRLSLLCPSAGGWTGAVALTQAGYKKGASRSLRRLFHTIRKYLARDFPETRLRFSSRLRNFPANNKNHNSIAIAYDSDSASDFVIDLR